jgi:rhodanese-related sulfurtransferase
MTKTTLELVNEAKQQITEISVEQAMSLLTQGIVALDVREPSEYEYGHLKNAINIPRGLLEFKIASEPMLVDKTTSVLVYCQTGGRSALATATLQQLGYSNAYSLQGGYEAWISHVQMQMQSQQ